MSINQFRRPKTTPLHSSGYARVASGESMGSVSPQSFDERTQIDRSRHKVKRYSSSMIARGNMREVARAETNANNPLRQGEPEAPVPRHRLNVQGMGARRGGARPTMPARKFTEAPTRGYNPFQ